MNMSVSLRQVVDSDSDILFKWINTRELVEFNAPFRVIQKSEHDAWFKNIRTQTNRAFFMIQHCETGVAIGSCQLHDINIVNRSAELQIRIGELKYQNKGGGSEAVRQLTNYGFTKLNLQRISLHVFATNIRALRVYEKNGFTREGFLRDAVIINGNSLDVIRMVKLEEADE